MRFQGIIQLRGINPYVHVSARIASKLKEDWRKPMPVSVRINGHPTRPWRINLMPVGDGSFYLYLHGSVRNVSRTRIGDRVTVDLSFDDTYRSGPMHPLPGWFRVALRGTAKAQSAWDALIPSRQKEVLRYFAALKSAEARTRNLNRAIQVLSGSEERFMGRTWKNGK